MAVSTVAFSPDECADFLLLTSKSPLKYDLNLPHSFRTKQPSENIAAEQGLEEAKKRENNSLQVHS